MLIFTFARTDNVADKQPLEICRAFDIEREIKRPRQPHDILPSCPPDSTCRRSNQSSFQNLSDRNDSYLSHTLQGRLPHLPHFPVPNEKKTENLSDLVQYFWGGARNSKSAINKKISDLGEPIQGLKDLKVSAALLRAP